MFWLNLYEIPPSQPTTPPLASRVTLAMNTQMKIFYRPKALKGNAENAAEAVSPRCKNAGRLFCCAVTNRSAFYLLRPHRRETDRRDYPVRQESDMMTAPFSMDYHLDGVTAPTILHRSPFRPPSSTTRPADRQVIHSKPITIKSSTFFKYRK